MKNYFRATSILFTTLSSLSTTQAIWAQNLQKQYNVADRTFATGSDSVSIHLNEVEGDGIVRIKGKTLTLGSIDFDVKGKDVLQRSFVGIAFHGLDDTTYEAVYFRPFNFLTTDPVRKAHAAQYIANPKYDWVKLRADYLNKYEKPVSPAPNPNKWFHLRMLVETKMISVYINYNQQAALTVEPLVNLNGKIDYWAGNNSGVTGKI